MALGKIKADTLEHSTAGSLDTKFVVNGSAKVRIKFTLASTFSTLDSFNVSSVDDDGLGDFGINFTSSMSDAEYVAPSACGEGNRIAYTNFGTVTSSSMDGEIRKASDNTSVDAAKVSISIDGDLA